MITVVKNTLFLTKQGIYARLENQGVTVQHEDTTVARIPLLKLDGIMAFGNVLLSPYLIEACTERGLSIAWFTESGRFTGRLTPPTSGNVLLRQAQLKVLDDRERQLHLARSFVQGKLKNSRMTIQRSRRDADDEEKKTRLSAAEKEHARALREASLANNLDELRGVEGQAAHSYFQTLSAHLKHLTDRYDGRTRRPPLDPINAALSFGYAMLANHCASALESVGLDPQVGIYHALRPGRPALALDLMEEYRAPIIDRLVMTLVNRKQLQEHDFTFEPGGAVSLNEGGRKTLIRSYQERRATTIQHPQYKERVPIASIPIIQSQLLARAIREPDTYQYIPFEFA